MKKASMEMSVGIFVLLGIICIGYLTIQLGNVTIFGDGKYMLEARFASVAGLTAGAAVEIAGVQVGTVESIKLDPKKMEAVVKLKIKSVVVLSDDSIASVKTSGLIGDKYISLSPGGSPMNLNPGDRITETESAVDIEELISKYVFGKV